MDHRLPIQDNVSNGEQNAKLRGSHLEIGNLKVTQRIAGQIDFDREHEIGGQESASHQERHIPGKGHSSQQEERAKGVHNMVNVKSVPGTRAVAKARQGPIEAITEPIERQAKNHHGQSQGIDPCPPIPGSCACHGKQAQGR